MQINYYFALIGLVNGLTALLVGTYVLLRNRKNPLHLSFFVFTSSVALWSICYAVWQLQHEKGAAFLIMQVTMFFCYFVPFTFYWFVAHLTETRKPVRFWVLFFTVPSFFAAFSFSRLTISDVVPLLYFPYWPLAGILMHFYIAIYFVVLFFAFALLFKTMKSAGSVKRRQLTWIAVPLLFGFSGGSTNWFLFYRIPVPPIPNVFVGLVFLILGYAVVRRELFDIDSIADIVREVKLSAMGFLTASINHEIRNPLFIIQGYADTFLANLGEGHYQDKDQAIEKSKQYMTSIAEQSKRAVDIMQRFAMFAKQNLNLQGQVQPVDLKAVVENILPLVRHELELDKIELDIRIDEGVPPLRADIRHIEEILLNLIVNACQAMKHSGGRIEVTGGLKGETIAIRVADNGPGIAEDRLRRIFEPFYTTKEEGTGLGLYVTKQLVERNGGRITVESKPGRGTTFIIDFRVT
ncbi:MAG: ATP-binding protein [Candidatus Omnitrophica bacterium]|nr:ATP-binding protein [Candidatus Omnitrophota bacterium]MDD5671255.1 ATP-binding protein [Candidatus Omnitrophota bacterium]